MIQEYQTLTGDRRTSNWRKPYYERRQKDVILTTITEISNYDRKHKSIKFLQALEKSNFKKYYRNVWKVSNFDGRQYVSENRQILTSITKILIYDSIYKTIFDTCLKIIKRSQEFLKCQILNLQCLDRMSRYS